MKAMLILLSMCFALDLWAVCNTPISRVNNIIGPLSVEMNSQLNAAYTHINTLPGDCIIDGSIISSGIDDNAVTTSKIADGTITSSKFANGTIPEFSRLLRVKYYTSSGTWIKLSDVSSILIHVVGGGGSSGYNCATASASSFGAYCVSNGGTSWSGLHDDANDFKVGGTASGGDINITGATGGRFFYNSGIGGRSFFGKYGAGATAYRGSNGGGAGGYCSRLIQRESLSDTVAVTIGAPGTGGAGGTWYTPGGSGLVIVYEYGN